MRMVMLKGASFSDIFPQFIKTLGYAVIMNGLAVWSYKKIN
jgi:ABC-2 type transport system permease protein